MGKMKKQVLQMLGFAASIAFASGTTFGAKLGHPGTSVKGATQAQNQVNLISDPPSGTQSGTITSTYDPSLLSISTVNAEPGYFINQVMVQTTNGYDTFGFGDSTSVTIGELSGAQVGAVQVSFDSDPSTAPIVVPDGTNPDGSQASGDLTHFITFDLTGQAQTDLASAPTTPLALALADPINPGGGATDGTALMGVFPTQDQYSVLDTTDPANPVTDTYYALGDPVLGPDGQPELDSNGNMIFSGTNAIAPASDMLMVTADSFMPEPASIPLMGISGAFLLAGRRRARSTSI